MRSINFSMEGINIKHNPVNYPRLCCHKAIFEVDSGVGLFENPTIDTKNLFILNQAMYKKGKRKKKVTPPKTPERAEATSLKHPLRLADRQGDPEPPSDVAINIRTKLGFFRMGVPGSMPYRVRNRYRLWKMSG
eukprot:Filipodium_phascolosomae@DN6470_c0_g1_i1.p1